MNSPYEVLSAASGRTSEISGSKSDFLASSGVHREDNEDPLLPLPPMSRALEQRLHKDAQLRQQIASELRKQNRLAEVAKHVQRLQQRQQAVDTIDASIGELQMVSWRCSVFEAAKVMVAHRTNQVLVLGESGVIQGMLSLAQISAAIADGRQSLRTCPVERVMMDAPLCLPLQSLSALNPWQLLAKLFPNSCISAEALHSLPLVDGDEIIGALTMRDMLRNRLFLPPEWMIAEVINANSELGDADNGNTRAWNPFGKLVSVDAQTSITELCRMLNAEGAFAALVVGGTEGHKQPGYRAAGTISLADILLRVVAGGLDPARTSVVRVMTPLDPTRSLPPSAGLFEVIDRLCGFDRASQRAAAMQKTQTNNPKINAQEVPSVIIIEDSVDMFALVDIASLAAGLLNAYNNIHHQSSTSDGSLLVGEDEKGGSYAWLPEHLPVPTQDRQDILTDEELSMEAEYDCSHDGEYRQTPVNAEKGTAAAPKTIVLGEEIPLTNVESEAVKVTQISGFVAKSHKAVAIRRTWMWSAALAATAASALAIWKCRRFLLPKTQQ